MLSIRPWRASTPQLLAFLPLDRSTLTHSMGLLQDLVGPISGQFLELGTVVQIGIVVVSVLVAVVFLNVAAQVVFRNPNEPPLVFHWFPLVGSTVSFGIDPPKFFQESRAKVSSATHCPCLGQRR